MLCKIFIALSFLSKFYESQTLDNSPAQELRIVGATNGQQQFLTENSEILIFAISLVLEVDIFFVMQCVGLAEDLKFTQLKMEVSLRKHRKNMFLLISTLLLQLTYMITLTAGRTSKQILVINWE